MIDRDEDAERIAFLKAKWAKRDEQTAAYSRKMAEQAAKERATIATLLKNAWNEKGIFVPDEAASEAAYDAIIAAGYCFARMDLNGWDEK